MKLGVKKKKYSTYSKEKKKKSNIKIIAIILGTTILVVCIYQFGVMKYYRNKVERETIAKITDSESEYVKAYALNKPIEKGNLITSEDLVEVTVRKNLVPETYLDNIGKLEGLVTRIGVSTNTVLSTDMLIKVDEEITDPIKNQDYDWIKVHAFLQPNDYVDIHLKEKDGTDTIVASKKKILNLNGTVFAINISEEERAYINNATVKASLMEGELYTSIYPDPENQKPASVTYKLDSEIEEKIKNDPNIVKKSAESMKNNGKEESSSNTTSGSNSVKTTNDVEKPNFIGGD